MNLSKLVVIFLAAIVMTACQPKSTLPDSAGQDTVSGGADGAGGASASGIGGGAGITGSEIGDDSLSAGGMAALDNLIVYFDFDQSDLRPEYADLLAAHASYLAGDGALRVRLEGHADERGSREYNIGLGERRAQAVRRMLLIQGAGAQQISTVSFGEERPAAFGSDEESYTLNRRVEIRYLK